MRKTDSYDYRQGRWVPGIGTKASMPVARISRRNPVGRGEQFQRCDHQHTTRGEAWRCAERWARELNA